MIDFRDNRGKVIPPAPFPQGTSAYRDNEVTMNRLLRLILLVSLLASGSALLAQFPAAYPGLDRHALRATKEDEQSVASLANYLTRTARSDEQKARAIYRWVTDRISYNAEGYFA